MRTQDESNTTISTLRKETIQGWRKAGPSPAHCDLGGRGHRLMVACSRHFLSDLTLGAACAPTAG